MAKRSYHNERFKNAQATPKKLNPHPNKIQARQYKRLFYLLTLVVAGMSLISISDVLIEKMTKPKKTSLSSKTAPSKFKIVTPLPEDHPSLPKEYGYETVLANRQVSISVEETGGKVVMPIPEKIDALTPDVEKKKFPTLILLNSNTPSQPSKESNLDQQTISSKVITPSNHSTKPNIPGIHRQVTFQTASLSAANAEKEAKALVAKIKQQKLNAYIESTRNGQGIMVHRVKVGPYPNESTQSIRAKLESIGLKPFEIHHP